MSKTEEPGFLREFVRFLVAEKKWWMIPLLVSLAVVALFTLLANSPAAPFIYTLF